MKNVPLDFVGTKILPGKTIVYPVVGGGRPVSLKKGTVVQTYTKFKDEKTSYEILIITDNGKTATLTRPDRCIIVKEA